MCQLSLPSAEFSKGLSNSLAFDTSLEKHIKLPRPSGDSSDLFALLQDRHAALETHSLNLGRSLIDLLSLLICNALDVKHLLLGAIIS